MACEVNDKEINSQCAEFLVRPSYIHYTYKYKFISTYSYIYVAYMYMFTYTCMCIHICVHTLTVPKIYKYTNMSTHPNIYVYLYFVHQKRCSESVCKEAVKLHWSRNIRSIRDPATPQKDYPYSKRCWDGLIRQWRRRLHEWDNLEEALRIRAAYTLVIT